jgi:hypothetical protein
VGELRGKGSRRKAESVFDNASAGALFTSYTTIMAPSEAGWSGEDARKGQDSSQQATDTRLDRMAVCVLRVCTACM